MTYLKEIDVKYQDSYNLDAFGRLRGSTPYTLFDSKMVKTVTVLSEPDFAVSYDGSTGTMQIDSIDGASPSSNSDLYDKLIALIA